MSCVVCELYIVQLRPAVDVLVVPYSVQLAMHLLVCYLSKFIQQTPSGLNSVIQLLFAWS